MNKNKQLLEDNKVDGIFISNLINVQYLTQFTGSTGSALITKDKVYIFVDPRYVIQAKDECPKSEVINYGGSASTATMNDALKEVIKDNKITTLGYEGDYITVSAFDKLKDALGDIDLVNVNADSLRQVKNAHEISLIKKACQITEKIYDYVIANVKVGMSELEVSNMMLNKALELGASGMSFDTIVASGVRSSLPHGVASSKIIEANDFITLDFGVFYQGYASDMTRTFVIGDKPDPKHEEIYEIVKEALIKATKSVKPGIKASKVDQVARDYIKEKGYGQYFTHGTGHAIGREIHELPYVNPNSQTILEPGMIITIEPGIYIEGFGGVRIEDDVLVTKEGHEVLTHTNRDLMKVEGK